MFHHIKNIHFVGIGGSGMSGIAEVLINLGYKVSGSDKSDSPATQHLKELGAQISVGHDAKNAKNAQVLVYSSAVDKQNPEILYAQKHKIPIIHRGEMLAEMMRLKHGIIIAGTHGKTTTTSLIASVLTDANLDPTIVIGGRLNSLNTGAKLGQGQLFVAEADESDGSFLKLNPTVAVITNIDKDHLDHYGSFEAIITAFESFIDKVPFFGSICLCIDDPIINGLLPKIRRHMITYGIENKEADVTAKDIQKDGLRTHFTPVLFGKSYDRVTLELPGAHNVLNALASFCIAKTLNLDFNQVSDSLSRFKGVLHRFTVIGETDKLLVIDDYAHNPKKIQTVLKACHEHFSDYEIIAVFQPHRYSRVFHQLEEFGSAFSFASYVCILPIYGASEAPIEGITHDVLAQKIQYQSFQERADTTLTVKNSDEAIRVIEDKVRSDWKNNKKVLIITLGAGDVKNIGPEVFKILSNEIQTDSKNLSTY